MVRTQFPPALSTAAEMGGKDVTVVCAVLDITEKWLQYRRKGYDLIVLRETIRHVQLLQRKEETSRSLF